MRQYLVMQVAANDEWMDEVPSYAVLPVDRESVCLMIEQVKSLWNVPGLFMGEFMRYDAAFVTSCDELDNLFEVTGDDSWVLTNTDLSVSKLEDDMDVLVRVDVPVMRCYTVDLEKPTVMFSAYVHNSTTEVYTDDVDLDELLKIMELKEGVS